MKTVSASVFALLLLAACDDQGPFERAGEELDEAVEDVRAGGETLPNRLDDAADEIRDEAEDVADELDN